MFKILEHLPYTVCSYKSMCVLIRFIVVCFILSDDELIDEHQKQRNKEERKNNRETE